MISIIKKKRKIIIALLVVLAIIGYLVVSYFLLHVRFFLAGGGFLSPVIWNNLEIEFPDNMYYVKLDNGISFLIWENDTDSLTFVKINQDNIDKETRLEFMKKKNYQILSTKEVYFNKYKSNSYRYIDDEGKYTRDYWIKEKNIVIIYEGEKDKFEDFKVILENMKFISPRE